MSDHPNADLFRRGFGGFGGEDGAERAVQTLAEDVVWWQIGSAEPLRGRQAVADSMQGFTDGVDFNVEIHDVVANDDHVVGLVTATVTAGGETFTYRTAEICHVKDGKITERWAFSDDTQRINDFFAQFSD